MNNPTAAELAQRLLATSDPDKPVLVDTGDGIYSVNLLAEGPNEVFIFLGRMP